MARLLNRLRAESGSIMVEVLVGTVLLALTTAAVLDGLDGAQKTGLENRNRSAAATLAQQDIERMRSMPPSVLANLDQTRTVTVGGVPYTVLSQTEWVRDASGLVSCTTEETEAEYIRLSATVTAPASPDRPVTETSLLTPPVGSFDEDTGTAAVKLTDRDGEPWENVNVDLAGSSSLSATTNDVGCAIFAFIAAGDWEASVDGDLVTWNGESPPESEVTVAAGKTSLTEIQIDDPGSLRANFVTPGGASTMWNAISVANAKLPNGYKSFQVGAMATSKDATSLFPFHDGYGVFAGTCEANNPALWDSDYFETSGRGFVVLDPGDLLKSVNVLVPELTVKVTRSTGPGGGGGSNASFTHGRIYIEQMDSAYDCGGVVYNSGEVATPAGFASPYEQQFTVPLPFGRYRVCAFTKTSSTGTSTWRRRISSTIGGATNPNLKNPPEPWTVSVDSDDATGSNAHCNTMPPS
jgi:Tfp pilus assembly protein PilV